MSRDPVTALFSRFATAVGPVEPRATALAKDPARRPTLRWKKYAWAGGLVLLLILGGMAASAFVPWSGPVRSPEDSAASYWRQAQAALADGDFDRARKHLEHCLEVSPLHAETHFLLARTARRSGDLAGWQRHLKNAEILQWPEKEIALEVVLGRAQAGDVRGAGQRLLPLLDSRHPEKALILEALVKGCLETNRWQEALHWTQVWIEHSPDDWQPFLYRGHACYLSRALKQAIADYHRVLECQEDHAEARLRLADAYLIEGQFELALVQYQAYIQKHPDHPAALVGAANCQFSLGRLEASRATLEQLFAKYQDPSTAPERTLAAGFFLRAKTAVAESDPAEGLTWLRRAEALVPDDRDIVYHLARVLRHLGQADEAAKYEHKLEDLRTQIRRLEDLRKLIKQDPDNVSLCHEAGMLCLRFGRADEAGQWFKSALQLDPNHGPTHQALADFFEKSGDTQRAARHRERAPGR